MGMVQCQYCKKTITNTSKDKNNPRKWCSSKCRGLSVGIQAGFYCDKGIPSGTVGAMSELMACTDLLIKGYEVFRSVSPSTSCDLLILKDKKIQRVEVRTGYRHFNGYLTYPKTNIRADITVVVVHRNNEVVYIPELK